MPESITLRLDLDVRKRLDKLAKATDRSRAALAAEAVRQYVELNEWQIAAIQNGLGDADNGRFIGPCAPEVQVGETTCACGGQSTLSAIPTK